MTSSTASLTTARSGDTMSSWIFSGSKTILLGRRLHLLGLLQDLVDRPDEIEGLLGDVVVLAGDDLLEAADALGDLDVLPRDAGELLGHEEGLRQELLD